MGDVSSGGGLALPEFRDESLTHEFESIVGVGVRP